MKNELIAALIRVLPFVALLVVIGVRRKQGVFSNAELYLQPPRSATSFLLCWLGFAGFVVLTEVLLYRAGLLEVARWSTHSVVASAIKIAGAVVLAPMAEELLFRGILLLQMEKRKVNRHLAIALQAIFFVLLHSFTYQNTFTARLGIVQGLMDATLYAYSKYYTRSIYTPMAMHATSNFIATIERFIL